MPNLSKKSNASRRLNNILYSLFFSCVLCSFLFGFYFSVKQEPSSPNLPAFSREETIPAGLSTHWQPVTVEANDTLENIFNYFGISADDLQQILTIPTARHALNHLNTGATLSFLFTETHQLQGLRYTDDRSILLVLLEDQRWIAHLTHLPLYQKWLSSAWNIYLTVDGLQAEAIQRFTSQSIETLQQLMAFEQSHPFYLPLHTNSLLHLNLLSLWQEALPAAKAIQTLHIAHLSPSAAPAVVEQVAPVVPAPAPMPPQTPQIYYVSSDQANINPHMLRQLRAIFHRPSERFSLLTDSTGHILLASITHQNKTYQAVRYTDSKGHTGYYTPQGQALWKASFLPAPVKYKYISDRFTPHRWHPILHIVRSHYGIDYAAQTGTPVRAIASGRIAFSGWGGGYGVTVTIQHNHRYQTLYAHLSHTGYQIRSGEWVKQGQVIGYVGESGLATGPHLHFGLYDYGTAVNPEQILSKFTPPSAIANHDLPDFLNKTNSLMNQLAFLQHNSLRRIT